MNKKEETLTSAKSRMVAIRLDEETARALKSKVAQEGTSIQSVLEMMIKEYLK